MRSVQFLSHPALSELLSEEDHKVSFPSNFWSSFSSLTLEFDCFLLVNICKLIILLALCFLSQIFKHLTSIEVEDSKDVKSGYSITFVSDCISSV